MKATGLLSATFLLSDATVWSCFGGFWPTLIYRAFNDDMLISKTFRCAVGFFGSLDRIQALKDPIAYPSVNQRVRMSRIVAASVGVSAFQLFIHVSFFTEPLVPLRSNLTSESWSNWSNASLIHWGDEQICAPKTSLLNPAFTSAWKAGLVSATLLTAGILIKYYRRYMREERKRQEESRRKDWNHVFEPRVALVLIGDVILHSSSMGLDHFTYWMSSDIRKGLKANILSLLTAVGWVSIEIKPRNQIESIFVSQQTFSVSISEEVLSLSGLLTHSSFCRHLFPALALTSNVFHYVGPLITVQSLRVAFVEQRAFAPTSILAKWPRFRLIAILCILLLINVLVPAIGIALLG